MILIVCGFGAARKRALVSADEADRHSAQAENHGAKDLVTERITLEGTNF
jgi:hypothetical protein